MPQDAFAEEEAAQVAAQRRKRLRKFAIAGCASGQASETGQTVPPPEESGSEESDSAESDSPESGSEEYSSEETGSAEQSNSDDEAGTDEHDDAAAQFRAEVMAQLAERRHMRRQQRRRT